RPYGEAVAVAVDQELGQAGLLALLLAGTGQHDQPVTGTGPAGPHLRSVEEPAAVDAGRRCAQRRQIGARVRLAHPDRERELTATDRGQDPSPLLGRTEAVDGRPALPVGDPVVADRGAPAQQLLDHDEPLDQPAVATAVRGWQRHAQPAALTEFAGELRIP